MKANARTYKVDPAKIVLAGESAGGFLVNYAGDARDAGDAGRGRRRHLRPGRLREDRAPAPGVSRPLQHGLDQRPSEERRQHLVLRREGYDEASFAKLKAISPLYAVHKGMPPFLAIHGTRDDQVPYEQSTILCEAMHEVGAAATSSPSRPAATAWARWKDADQQHYKAEMVAWLKQVLDLTAR